MTTVFESLDSSLPADQTTRQFDVQDSSHVGEVRRAVAAVAERAQLDDTAAGRAAIIATEACNNVLLHAGGGTALVRHLANDGRSGVELIVFDKGPGMDDVGRSLADGHSTIGTAGQGLGAIQRSSSVFDIYSQRGRGTVVLSQVWDAIPSSRFETGVVGVPVRGEEISGDAWIVTESPQLLLVGVIDGLGHGPIAAEASQRAVQVIRSKPQRDITALLQDLDNALRATRGAAAAIATIDEDSVSYGGVGNISGVCHVPTRPVQHMISHNGTLGHQARKFQTFTYPPLADGLLIMHSDGISTQWRIDEYAGVSMKHPAIAATLLYRDFSRGRDDATVVALRKRP